MILFRCYRKPNSKLATVLHNRGGVQNALRQLKEAQMSYRTCLQLGDSSQD